MTRRLARAYHLACARDDVHALGLNVPLGVWFCDHCRLVLWEPDAFRLHLASHPA
jgi:hypothetical protein